jgi:transcription termination/antitermination protein NusG
MGLAVPEAYVCGANQTLTLGDTQNAEWFALRVRPKHEKAVAATLAERGFEEFLPLYRTKRRWSDRTRELELPLFGGYTFCRFPYAKRVRILQIPGVMSILTFGNRPVPLSENEIDNLKAVVASGLPVGPWPYLKIGQRVRIERGPLREVEGVVLRLRRGWRVVVSVDVLQRSVAVELDLDLVSPLRDSSIPHLTEVSRRAGPREAKQSEQNQLERLGGCAERAY